MNRLHLLGLGVLLVVCCRPSEEAPVYGAGRPATNEEIAAWDIDVNASGLGLPAGRGSVQDGAYFYAAYCARCHGGRGEGTTTGSQLVKPDTGTGRRNIYSHWPYAAPLFDYIRRAMPPDRDQSYGADTLYAILAWLLDANGIAVTGGQVTSTSLPEIALPARQRFVLDNRRGGRELR